MTMQLYVLDYGAGNVQSLGNALTKLGYEFKYVKDKKDFALADKVIFPGVGNFGEAMQKLENMGIVESLKEYIAQNRPFMGICVGLQCLFESSAEAPNLCGLSIIPAKIQKFDSGNKSVPHIGWNFSHSKSQSIVDKKSRYYFVHSYAAIINEADTIPENYQSWIHTLTTYGSETFVSTVKLGNVFATQFHPEKSGNDGLALIDHFLKESPQVPIPQAISIDFPADGLSKRIIACLDVRANDNGELVVTKGDQYDVREEAGNVRNMGNPMEMAAKYFEQGADEIVFLNITSFREYVPGDNLMLSLLKQTSKNVFVPLTIGGGIRDMKSPDGKMVTAFQVAEEYFRSGADKVSIGSDAVYITQRYLKEGAAPANAISSISKAYGAQAVVVSVDPRMIYISSPDSVPHSTCKARIPGPNGEQYCWYQCTVKGGREGTDIDVVQLAKTVEKLGAGEILLNCMDQDGRNSGYDLELIKMVKSVTSIPIIASSGAGKIQHFEQVFTETNCDAALAAGIFHREEVKILQVKEHLNRCKFQVRL